MLANSQLSRLDADNLMRSIVNNDTTIIIYGFNESIVRGDSIVTADGISMINPYDVAYVFFIDDIPAANWAHKCRYCFINKINGAYFIEDQKFYPSNHESFIQNCHMCLKMTLILNLICLIHMGTKSNF